jgi:hypothetical protein
MIENDRSLFYPYFEAAEKFCADNDIIIGGNVGVDLLLGRKIHHESQPWDLYCSEPYQTAKTLADTLYGVKNAHIDNTTCALQTNIKNRELTITIDTRIMFRIYLMDKYRGADLVAIMSPVTVTGYFGSQIKIFPREIVLIGLYQGLYTPAKFKLWQQLIDNEAKLIGKTGGDVTGGGDFNKSIAADILLKSLCRDPRVVVIGEFAADALGAGAKINKTRLQIITNIPVDELCEITSRALSNEKDKLRRLKVTNSKVISAKYFLNIPSDFQIIKHTIYAIVNGEQVALYDTFNSTEYEMIPWIQRDRIQCAHPFVILRFCYIDIWIMKLINGMNRNNSLDSRISSIEALAEHARRLLFLYPMFQTDNYAGINTSETVAKKKLIGKGPRIPNYYPAAM